MEINDILGGKTKVIDVEVSEQVLKRINKYMKKNIIVSRRKLLSLIIADYFLKDEKENEIFGEHYDIK
jgi:metal-responsive CopG/Arc/MetJ family transcriptional regulator